MLSHVWLFCNPLDCGWERLKAGGEGDDRGWDGWVASPTQSTWVWASSGRWWRTGKPGGLQSMGLQRVRHDRATEHQDYSPPALVHGIFQARILEWVAISFSRESSWSRDWTYVSCIGRQILYLWATREALSLPKPISPVSFPASFSPQALIPHICGVPLSPLACTFLSTSPNLEAPERFLAATRKK